MAIAALARSSSKRCRRRSRCRGTTWLVLFLSAYGGMTRSCSIRRAGNPSTNGSRHTHEPDGDCKMIRSEVREKLWIVLLLVSLVASFPATAQTDPLPSWNEGGAKQA